MIRHFIFITFLWHVLTAGSAFGQATFLLNEAELIEEYGENDNFKKGNKLYYARKFEEARLFFQKAVLDFEKANAWELFILANRKLNATYKSAKNYQEGIEITEQAIKKIEKEAPAYTKFTPCLYHEMGFTYSSVSQFEKALATHQRQLNLLQNHYPLDSNWDFVIAYNGIAGVYKNLGEFEQSLEYYLKTIKIVEELNLTSFLWTIGTLSGLISVCTFRMGKHGTAIKIAKKILNLAINKYGENALELVEFYLLIARTLSSMNERAQSIDYYKKSLFILEKHNATHRIPHIFKDLGDNYKALVNLDQALYYWQKYLDAKGNDPSISAEKIGIATSMAGIYISRKEYEKAVEYFNRADTLLQIMDSKLVNKEQLFHKVRSFHWYYAQYWRAIKQPQKEKKHLLELLNNYSMKGSEWQDSGSYRQLADVYASEGNLDSAFHANQIAIVGLCNNFKPKDIHDLPAVNDLRNYTWVYGTLDQKVWIYSLMAEDTEGSEQKRQYFEAGMKAVDLVDEYHLINMKQVNLLRGSNSNRLIETSFLNYKSGLQLAYDYFEACKEETMVEKGFYYVQKMKSQNLWQALLKSDAVSFGALDETILEQEKAIQNEITLFEKKLLEAQENQDTQLIDLYQNEHLFDLRKEFSDLQETIESKYPDYFESKYNFVPETGKSLQKVLHEDELLIDYLLHNEALYIFTVGKDKSLQIHKVACNEEKTSKLVSDFKTLLENSTMLRKSSREKFIAMSYELYQQFIAPIESQIAKKNRLIIIGDGLTNYIPFEVLLKTNEVKPFQDLEYLVKNFEISYHYSATLFAKAKRKPIPDNSGIFAFAPVYDDPVETEEQNDIAVALPLNSELRAINPEGNFSPLPASANEVKSILNLFKQQNPISKNTLALRATALESTLKNHLEKPYQFIHIAGHSFANLENPKFSGIACFKKDEKEDGILFSGEIYNIRTKADLVTLSSCESGYGKLGLKEGLLGINRAFIYAGTPNVVFSLWKVYDKVSSNLMIDFYENILEGKDYSESLRAAKLKLIENEATASPHFWSPFLLIGR